MKMNVLIFLTLLLTVTLSQNWNWIRVATADTPLVDVPLAITQSKYAPMIPYNWWFNQHQIDDSLNPGNVYFLRTFAAGTYIELGQITNLEQNVYSPVNGGVDRSPLFTLFNVVPQDVYPSFPHQGLVAHSLTRIHDPRQDYLTDTAFNYGGFHDQTTLYESMHYLQGSYFNETLSFDAVAFPGYGRAFHSAVYDPNYSATLIGAVYIWGGVSEVIGTDYIYTNSLLRFDLQRIDDHVLNYDNIAVTEIVQGGQVPTARGAHSATLYDGKMIIFGGFDGTNTYSTVASCDLATGIWTTKRGAPVERAFHMGSLINDFIYVFAGSSANAVYNDLKRYDILLDQWEDIPTEVTIRPRIGHTGFVVDNRILIQGGTDDTVIFSDWWMLEVLRDECLYYCSPIEECVSSRLECDQYVDCLDSDGIEVPFRCEGGSCFQTPTSCDAFTTCTSGEVLCWNGLCAPSIPECAAYPACPVGIPRCTNGECSLDCVSDKVDNCNQKVCADGTCAAECMESHGCLPVENNTLCANGRCVQSPADCLVPLCQTQQECWDGTCRLVCDAPLFRRIAVSVPFKFTVPAGGDNLEDQFEVFPQGLEEVEPSQDLPSQALALLIVENKGDGATDLDLTGHVRAVPFSEIADVGNMPHWDQIFNPSVFTSAIISVSFDGYDADQLEVQMLLKQEDALDQNSAYCMAHPVDWYWTQFDSVSWNVHADLPHFVEFRNLYVPGEDPEAALTTDLIANIATPAKRWKCSNGDYPRFVTAIKYTGFRGSYVDDWVPMVLVKNPPPYAEPIIPPLDWIQYFITGVAALVFVVMLVVTIVQWVTSDSCNCM